MASTAFGCISSRNAYTTSCLLCPCVVGAGAKAALVKCARTPLASFPPPGSSPPHFFLTGTPSPWSARHVICHPQHPCPSPPPCTYPSTLDPATPLCLSAFEPLSLPTIRLQCHPCAAAVTPPLPQGLPTRPILPPASFFIHPFPSSERSHSICRQPECCCVLIPFIVPAEHLGLH